MTVVTGAGGGIGRCLCDGLAAAGHQVLAVVRSEASARALAQAPVDVVLADLALPSGRAAVREAVERGPGRLTGLVNNAGIGMTSLRPDYYKRPVQPEEVTPDLLERFLAVNAHAPVALALELLACFAPGGHILNVGTSLTAMLRPGFLPYAMSKAALESASAVLARDLGPRGMAVTVLNPGGPVDTPMARRDEAAARAGLIAPERMVAPVAWVLGAPAALVNGQRVTATLWRPDDPQAALAPIGWPQLATDSSWAPAGSVPRPEK